MSAGLRVKFEIIEKSHTLYQIKIYCLLPKNEDLLWRGERVNSTHKFKNFTMTKHEIKSSALYLLVEI